VRVGMESILGGQTRWRDELLSRGTTSIFHRASALVDDHPALTRTFARLDPLGDALIAVVVVVVLAVSSAVRLRFRSVRAQRSASSLIDQTNADDAGRSASRH
jgi:hypothetical protein